MENKDWEEIENWYKEKNTQNKYNFSEEEKKKMDKSVNIFVRFLNIIGRILKTTGIGIFIIVGIGVSLIISIIFGNIESKTNIGVKKALEPRYNIKVEIIEQQIDEKENGKYLLQLKDNKDIKFTAIKKFGNLTEDYSTRAHKYYFEKWNDEDKKYFTVEENIENDILYYATYIDNFTDIEKATNSIIKFANYCGDKFMPNWRIFLKKGDIQIYPYPSANMTEEEAMQNSKELYQKYFK